MSEERSYRQILRTSSIIGGSQIVILLLGLVRVKFSALLIGPIGIGTLGNYTSIQGLFGSLAGLGIQSSGVREVAASIGRDDPIAVGRTVTMLRRVCWLTGVIGTVLLASLSVPLSYWTFGDAGHAIDIALLGVTILLGNIAGGQMAMIQGLRRIGDLARINIFSVVVSTPITIICYATYGMQGIVAALLISSAANLGVSFYYARRIPVPAIEMTWTESLVMARGMIGLGMTFMFSALVGGLVTYLTRAFITQQVGLEAAGIFNAAFALSGMFAGFILSAMGSDYFPRLTSVASDRDAMTRLVNEQTEVGVLLAVPGLLATLGLAPWIINFFYTSAFLPASSLLQWFILGCLGRVVSWPLGYVMLALGKAKWFVVSEGLFSVLHLGLIVIGVLYVGTEGAAMAFFVLYVIYTIAVYGISRQLIGFRWTPRTQRLLLLLLPVVVLTFVASRLMSVWSATILTGVVTSVVAILCLRGLVQRVGLDNAVVRIACRIPGAHWMLGIK